jgi:hypothetical protein
MSAYSTTLTVASAGPLARFADRSLGPGIGLEVPERPLEEGLPVGGDVAGHPDAHVAGIDPDRDGF